MDDKTLQLVSALALAVAAAILFAALGTAFYVLDLYHTLGAPVVVGSGDSAPNYWFAAVLVVLLPLAVGVVVFLSVYRREPRAKRPRYNWR